MPQQTLAMQDSSADNVNVLGSADAQAASSSERNGNQLSAADVDVPSGENTVMSGADGAPLPQQNAPHSAIDMSKLQQNG